MATTAPRVGGPPNGSPGPVRPASPAPRALGRWIAVGALALVVAVVAYLAFSGGTSASYKFEMETANQLVLGDQVQVGGVPVGSVTGIALGRNYRALITIHIEGGLVPLREGTTVQVRVPSLTTVAGRYVALSPGANSRAPLHPGTTLPYDAAQTTTDLDQLFNALDPRTRKGLQQVFQGTAEQYAGASEAAGLDAEYFAPALGAANLLFAELSSDQKTLTEFLVHSARALGTLAANRQGLTGAVENGNHAFQALGAEQASLQRGVALLPAAIEQGNRAFAQLPPTFAALRQLLKVSGPDTKQLAPLFAKLRPLVAEAGPVLHNLSLALNRPGSSNDLTDAALALPGLAQTLESNSPNTIRALQESVPTSALFAPYAPDLQGAARDLGVDAGYYDGNGNYVRVSAVFDNFTLGANNTLTPATTPQGLNGLHSRELRRCPGSGATPSAADGSTPFTNEGKVGCDLTQVP